MKIEAMAGYLQEFIGRAAVQDPSILGLQHQIASLTEKLKYIQLVRPARPNVWCTHCLMEGHVAKKCLRLQGANVGISAAETQGAPPVDGVAQINTQGLYQPQPHFPWFPNQQNQTAVECYEICKGIGHPPRLCPILKKYSNVPNNIYCEFCAYTTHTTNQCRAFDALAE